MTLSTGPEKNANWKPESFHGRKGVRGKMLHQETLWQSRPMRFSGCAWKISCCGIFCASQEGSEGKGKIPCHISSQNRVSRSSHVQILRSIQKRLLCLRSSPWQAGERCGSCGSHRAAEGRQFSHLRLSADVAVVKKPEYFL